LCFGGTPASSVTRESCLSSKNGLFSNRIRRFYQQLTKKAFRKEFPMTSSNKRVLETLSRVLVFGATFPQWFPTGTVAGELMAKLKAAVDKLSGHAAAQFSGNGAMKRSRIDRAQARQALRDQLEAMNRIARALQLPQFWMPRDRGDRRAVEVGKAFITHAEPLKQLFVDNHLPADFIDKLKLAIQNLETAIESQTASKGGRRAATTAIDEARREALAVLQHLDPIMQNLLAGDPPALAVWESARHVAWSIGSKPDPIEGAVSPTAPAPPDTSLAATV
jgi:hypothetical protein